MREIGVCLLPHDQTYPTVACKKIEKINLTPFLCNRITDGGGNLFSGDLHSILQSASYYDVPSEQGAAIFRSIIKNHTFENGNKRTAIAAYKSFAGRTGLTVNLTDSQMFELTLRVERGDLVDVSDIAEALR